MAAVSAPQASNAYTPPDAPGGQASWSYSIPAQTENIPPRSNDVKKPPLAHANGNSMPQSNTRGDSSQRNNTQPLDTTHLAPRITALTRKDSSISDTGSAPDSLLDLYGQNRSGMNSFDYGDSQRTNGGILDEEDPEHSRWIHRDKLARIESQELQAAGIILPRSRAPSRSRNERSRDQQGNGVRSEQAQKRIRMESIPTEEEEAADSSTWDLRSPEEVAEAEAKGEFFRDISSGVKGVSRIPVLKTSPLPIPLQHLERDTPMKRKLSAGNLGEEDSIVYPKNRSRSQSIKVLEDASTTPAQSRRIASEGSPSKKPATRKASGPGTPSKGPPSTQRPKTRSGQDRDASGNQRPSTRSGELGKTNSIGRAPEGDPPWLASMYKPDPRLPPDQQLLPTVARRLQQEQWEKEGKFGNVYDTNYRPLNDSSSPEPVLQYTVPEEKTEEDRGSEWPLRGPKSPTLSTGRPGTAGGQGSYSTMPKIQSPQGVGGGPLPLPSPKPPIRVREPPEDTKKGGCGCCVVM